MPEEFEYTVDHILKLVQINCSPRVDPSHYVYTLKALALDDDVGKCYDRIWDMTLATEHAVRPSEMLGVAWMFKFFDNGQVDCFVQGDSRICDEIEQLWTLAKPTENSVLLRSNVESLMYLGDRRKGVTSDVRPRPPVFEVIRGGQTA